MRAASLRTLASIAAQRGLSMRRWDFVAAYLQGELEPGEVVYCHPPPGYEFLGQDGKPRVCRVFKPIYGMAQAGRRWQRSLFPWLIFWGFKQRITFRSLRIHVRTCHRWHSIHPHHRLLRGRPLRALLRRCSKVDILVRYHGPVDTMERRG
eukprot:1393027-Pleurochrysis_carterae.AAC.1